MASQRALRLIEKQPHDEGQVLATFELACGCVVTRAIAADRIQPTSAGETLLVGKFPCPERHPLARA